MKLSYNVTGMERKALVGAISHALNAPTKYLGMPTAAYEVGGYHIDKTGTVTGKDNRDLEDALRKQGFDAVEREYGEPDAYQSGLGGMGAALDSGDLELNGCEDRQGENGMRAPESARLVIEMPLEGFTPEKLDNLTKLVSAKAPLLKAALGADDLPIEQTANTLRFPWFGDGLDAETVKAYASLIGMICAAAKVKHRVIAHEKNPENKKYAMRTWLLSLGFIGDEYKASRRILLRNLSGDSSYAKKANMQHKLQG